MKEYVKKALLGVLILIALSACGTIVLKIFDMILHIGFDNIVYEGFKVGLVASVLLLLDYLRKKKARA